MFFWSWLVVSVVIVIAAEKEKLRENWVKYLAYSLILTIIFSVGKMFSWSFAISWVIVGVVMENVIEKEKRKEKWILYLVFSSLLALTLAALVFILGAVYHFIATVLKGPLGEILLYGLVLWAILYVIGRFVRNPPAA